MKFSCACIAAALTVSGFASTPRAFSAVAPPSKAAAKAGSGSGSGGAPNLDPVDKTMGGVDAGDDSAFDPTSGAGAALTRNNKGEVWVPQVRVFFFIVVELGPCRSILASHYGSSSFGCFATMVSLNVGFFLFVDALLPSLLAPPYLFLLPTLFH